jgi:hypothetical protein
MMPTSGQHVKCILKNGAVVEGIVEEWSTNSVELRSLDGESILIIPRPNEDIMLIKVLLEKLKPEVEIIKEKIIEKGSLEEELQKTVEQTSNDLRLKKMAELKILLAQQERKIITDKLKDHHISDVRKAQYERPGFFKKDK